MTISHDQITDLTELTETRTVRDRDFPAHSWRGVWCREADLTATYVVDEDGGLFIETWGTVSDLGFGCAVMGQHGWAAERGDEINPPESVEQARQWLRDEIAILADEFRDSAPRDDD